MGFQKTYFKPRPDDPKPLSASTTRRIRFEEVDMLGIVWHGHYVSFLDDGRIAFADKYGLSYMAMRVNGIAAPIVQMHLDYISPLYFDNELKIEAILHWTDSLKLNFEFRLTCEGRLVARGYTVQLFVDLQGNLVILPPNLIKNFRQKWANGELK